MGVCSSKKATVDSVPPTEKPEVATSKGSSPTAATTPVKAAAAVTDLSQQGLMASDAELSSQRDHFASLAERFNLPASDDVIATAKANLEKGGFIVKIAADAKDALDYITMLPKEGNSISSGGSRTLDEIGFVDWAKTQTKFKDFKAEALTAEQKGDWSNALRLRKEGSQADFYFASAAAVSQDGAVMWGSATGTRVSINAGVLVFVVGTQKIVKDETEAEARMYEWQLPLESARARVAYKVPGSALNEVGTLRRVNPYAPGTVQIVFVPGLWGY